ncbi:uncharacterized protein LOC110864682 isoform X3 [Helianthus annuus]|uniref:uncharacterized protein LOC110864682 isoform X3 n=1 Tax=Helianthus annuus TaxID=4232 RepID=UPI000B8F86FE|nr:uncharacterized protein LOC110864682 isoform X3 [Helianthus annuus]XP_021969488.1 uncharacterized protein LOC110864682 isoform X3 [Helianthus annuus]
MGCFHTHTRKTLTLLPNWVSVLTDFLYLGLVSIQVMPAVKIVTKTIGCIINADGLGTEVNKEGIMYYNNLINYLLEKGSSFPSNSAGYSPPGSVAGSLAWEGRPLPRSGSRFRDRKNKPWRIRSRNG